MRLKHRPFHWPAMSGIMPPMVALYESYVTSQSQSTSLYQRTAGKPAIQAVLDDFVGGSGPIAHQAGEALVSWLTWA